jgi:hypothetical protein
MSGPFSILGFIAYCGGLQRFLSLMETINRAEKPVYQIAAEWHLAGPKISRFLSKHYRREYAPTDDTQIVLEHEIALVQESLNERARKLTRKGRAPILPFTDAGSPRA